MSGLFGFGHIWPPCLWAKQLDVHFCGTCSLFLVWVALHSSYCSSNSSPPSYPLIRTPWAKTQVPAVHSQKSLVIASSVCFIPPDVWKIVVCPSLYGWITLQWPPMAKNPPLINHFPIQIPIDGGFPTDFPLIWWPGVPIYGFWPNHP